MDTKKGNRVKTVDMTIRPNDGNKWSAEKTEAIGAMAKLRHGERSEQRLLRNAMSAVRYHREEYVADEDATQDCHFQLYGIHHSRPGRQLPINHVRRTTSCSRVHLKRLSRTYYVSFTLRLIGSSIWTRNSR